MLRIIVKARRALPDNSVWDRHALHRLTPYVMVVQVNPRRGFEGFMVTVYTWMLVQSIHATLLP
jgi:hypothetical protein